MTRPSPDDSGTVPRLWSRLAALPEGAGIQLAFMVVAVLAVTILLVDVGTLTAGRSVLPEVGPSDRPVRMARPQPDNQIRPYLPTSRPIAPDSAGADGARDRPRAPDEADPMTFRLGADGSLFAAGTIVPGSYGDLERLLNSRAGRDNAARAIVLHSPGGSVRDAIAMARLIRKYHLDTSVVADGYCASSCPLVFAGGVARKASPQAWIGVHQVYAQDSEHGSLQQGMDEAQRVSAQAQALLVELGVDPRLWIHAMQTPKDKLYLLTPKEMVSFRLATKLGDAN